MIANPQILSSECKMKEQKMKHKPEKQSEKKYQRYVFVVLFLVVLGVTNAGTYFLSARGGRDADTSHFSLLNPARNFFKQEDLIINFQPLRDYLNDKYEADPNVSVYFEYLPTGANIAINKDAEFYPASLLKVPVAMAVAKKIDKGEWKWTNELVLMSADKDDAFGTLYKETTNSTFTIEELVNRSLSESDNTAHFMLVRNLEISEIEDVYDHMGLVGFLSTKGNLSAKKYSLIFRALYNSSYISENNSQKLLDFLAQSAFKEYIERGLPKEIVFSHKIGISEDKKLYLDSGIVYSENRQYLLTIMINGKNEQKSKEIMEDISKKVYTYVGEYNE